MSNDKPVGESRRRITREQIERAKQPPAPKPQPKPDGGK